MMNKQSTLWSVLAKYDGLAEFNTFCDSISNFIQNKSNGDDIITVYQNLAVIDKEDYKKINEVIGVEINNYLFTIGV